MSKEAASAFLAKANDDSDFKDKIAQLGSNAGFDGLQDFAAAQGFQFTLDELVAAGEERSEQTMSPSGELSESELESVAGGARSNWTIYISKASIYVSSY